jgi:predicted GNAT superfamily acetyltransferase
MCGAQAVEKSCAGWTKNLVTLGRFELPTSGLGNRCSIQLSYRATGVLLSYEHQFIATASGRKAILKWKVVRQNTSSLPMSEFEELGPASLEAALSLNNAHAKETSLLDEWSLGVLLNIAFYARGLDRGATALLIALDHNAPYDNPNFNWFKQRLDAFVYIDRIIVADCARSRGIARRLYLDLFAASERAGHTRVVCEVNMAPPNPASDAFHAAMGFVEVGRATIHDGLKTVRYFEKALL